MDKSVQKAKYYSIKAHNKVNQTYGDGKSYSFHLEMVDKYGEMFIHLIKDANDKIVVRCAIWGHDRIEDCRETYNDLAKYLGKDVADVIYGVTDEKGRTRDERKPKKLYDGMLKDVRIKYVKLADRLANIEYSKSEHDEMSEKKQKYSMFSKLCRENVNFKKKLFLTPNMIEMCKVVGFVSTFKVFRHFSLGNIIVNTFKNRKSEPLQEMWDLINLKIKTPKY